MPRARPQGGSSPDVFSTLLERAFQDGDSNAFRGAGGLFALRAFRLR